MNRDKKKSFNKEKLMENLKYDTYVRLAPSKIHGVGVIAIKDIPVDTNPFMITGKTFIDYKSIPLNGNEISELPKSVKVLVKDFIISDRGLYHIPYNGFNSLDLSFYLNHSNNNNLDIVDSQSDYLEFISNRKIKKGEELTINYKSY